MPPLSASLLGAWHQSSRVMRLFTSPGSDTGSDDLMAEKLQALETISPLLEGCDINEAIAEYRLQLLT